ncbi:MAG: glutamate-1-semialdehyde 2,1-aminomutase [Myxococcota bacterium]
MKTTRSRREFARAKKSIPGGVNSPVRAFGSVGGIPRFIAKAKGARITDVDGNTYIDYVGSWGPMILGHAHPKVLAAVREAMRDGTSFGAPTPRESDLAEAVRKVLPSVEMMRMVSSGTEATMSALRLARAVTGRPRILKFDGCYHGHADGLLVGAGSGVATLGIPGSPGVPQAMTDLTIIAPYNDLAATREAFRKWGEQIAAIIVEPVAGNMGCVPPVPGFLEGLRSVCDEYGALLVFDEVMTGFRVARGGAQRLYGIRPDLTTLGKVVGGGLPAAAYGGRRDLMRRIAPEGDVYQAGTLSGNPLAVAAGLTTLRLLEARGVYETLSDRARELVEGLEAWAYEQGIPITTARVGGMFGFFFHPGPVESFAQAQQNDAARFRRFFAAMLDSGVYLAPSPYEAGFVSLAHRPRDIDQTVEAARKAFARCAAVR